MSELFGTSQETHAYVMDRYADELERTDERWKSLETKAQGTITIAGIFMGFTLTFAKDFPIGSSAFLVWSTLVAIAVLVASIVSAAISLLITKVAEPPAGSAYAQFGDDYHLVEGETGKAEFARVSWPALRGRWQTSIDKRNEKNVTKARAVLVAQLFMFAAILLAAIVAGRTAWMRGHSTPLSQPSPGVTIYEMRQVR